MFDTRNGELAQTGRQRVLAGERATRDRLNELRIVLLTAQSRNAEAIAANEQALDELGVATPLAALADDAIGAVRLHVLAAACASDETARRPAMTDACQLACMRLDAHDGRHAARPSGRAQGTRRADGQLPGGLEHDGGDRCADRQPGLARQRRGRVFGDVHCLGLREPWP